ncbi:MAG: SDR family NAD(P)-dependent oxidoreductase [Leptolyngbyaceae cyanobacterium]
MVSTSSSPAPLSGQVALVTGATRGIGKGIAIGLAQAGATVYITGRSVKPDDAPITTDGVSGSLQETETAIAQVVDLAQSGGRCIAVATDHGDDDQVRSLFERIATDQNNRLDILVNNVYAGVSKLRATYESNFWDSDVDLWDACNHVGLRSHYLASIYGARLMVPRQRGLICTISSWGSLMPIFGAAYGTGKAACDRLSFEMARELKPHGITALSLWPGIVGTEHITQAFANSPPNSSPNAPTSSQADSTQADPKAIQSPQARAGMIRDQYNWETPEFTGKVLAALAADPKVMQRSGKVNIVAEVAKTYGILDQEGRQPASLRSLRFMVPYAVPSLQSKANWIPDWRIPWWLLLLTSLASPKAISG